jgi:aspartyl protease family protein
MLLRIVIFASVVALLATQIPAIVDLAGPPASTSAPAVPQAAQQDDKPQPAALPNGRVKLVGDSRGHFNGSFRINGKPVDGLIDTGASMVAINESTARRLGFGANGLDFRYTINTANGTTDGAQVILDRIEIGSIRVRDVQAFVLRDKALSNTLVGMTFLKKLKSYQVQDGNLTLAQ